MNILAIDYGTKNIGLAWCQKELGVVLPFGNVESGRWKVGLVNLIKKEKVDKVVVGLPVGLDGKENENTKKIREFVDELKKEYGSDSVIDINGARVKFDDGWFLVRASSNMPVLTLGFEAKTKERLEELQQILKKHLDKYPEISKEWKSG